MMSLTCGGKLFKTFYRVYLCIIRTDIIIISLSSDWTMEIPTA